MNARLSTISSIFRSLEIHSANFVFVQKHQGLPLVKTLTYNSLLPCGSHINNHQVKNATPQEKQYLP